MEPINGSSGGAITPPDGYWEEAEKILKENDILLIADEVMTGFRISYGGAQQHWGITPDLSTFGKVIGGGLPVGAYAGKKEIMETRRKEKEEREKKRKEKEDDRLKRAEELARRERAAAGAAGVRRIHPLVW